jgi:acyl-CoA hydrolase
MSWIDVAGAIAAQRHCRRTVVTASIDELSFIAGVKQGWFVILRARVNYTGRTSMEVGVRVEAENPKTGERYHTATAYLTYVALDDLGKPATVAPLVPRTEEQKRRFDEAKQRRDMRLKGRSQKK